MYNEQKDLKFNVTLVTRLQNRFKNSIPIIAILLTKSTSKIHYSLIRVLHCIIVVESRKPSKDIPHYNNC